MLALNEIRRSKGRFASIVSALSLIVFLVLILGALSDGLFYGSTGAIRSSNAIAYAFSEEATDRCEDVANVVESIIIKSS